MNLPVLPDIKAMIVEYGFQAYRLHIIFSFRLNFFKHVKLYGPPSNHHVLLLRY